MQQGRLYIDGIDVYAEYGAFVTDGGYNDLVCYPPMKEVKYNDWHEEDGIEPDLSNPRLASRRVSVPFAFASDGYMDFLAFLSDGITHVFEYRDMGRIWKLRLAGHSSITTISDGVFLCTLAFVEDAPAAPKPYDALPSSLPFNDDYKLDDTPLSAYGIMVLEKSTDDVMKTPEIKANLSIGINGGDGDVYDDAGVPVFASKDVVLHLLLTASTLDELWQGYDALLFDLMRPHERTLYVKSIAKGFKCYYKSMNVTEFAPNNEWLKFDLTIVFTDFKWCDDVLILASESGDCVITELDDMFINMEE